MPEAESILESADAAVVFARVVRQRHRKRTPATSKQRQADIRIALDRLAESMTPLRSEIGRFPYGSQSAASRARQQAIRDASAAIQVERRKLWKMQPREKKPKVNNIAV